MCSDVSYFRLINFFYHPTLSLTVIEKREGNPLCVRERESLEFTELSSVLTSSLNSVQFTEFKFTEVH